MVRIIREEKIQDSLRNYEIFIDGIYCGTVSNGGFCDINIPDGQHNIYLKIDQCSSQTLYFETRNNELVEFKCGNYSKNAFHMLCTSIVYTTKKKNQYIKLERI